MKTAFRIALLTAVALTLSLGTFAGDVVMLTGDIVCAKCSLKKADAKECQDVLVVGGEKGGEYYLAKNDVAEKFGHVCQGKKPVTATGTVVEKDGKKWLTATKMMEPAKKG